MRAICLGLLALVLLGTTGCLGLGGGRSPATRFYVLTPQTGAPRTAPARTDAALRLGAVTLPGYLDRPQIVTRSGDRVQFAEFDRWAESLPDSVPRILAEDLGTLLPDVAVARGAAPIGPPTMQLAVSVSRFDGALGGEVVLEARWRLTGPADSTSALHTSRIVERADGSGYDGMVAAMSRALGQLARDVAAAVRSMPQSREGA